MGSFFFFPGKSKLAEQFFLGESEPENLFPSTKELKMKSTSGPSCPLVKPGKENASKCAINFLTVIMKRKINIGEDQIPEESYTPDEIEKVIYDNYPTRDLYLSKIAKVGLHLSLFTRTGRVSWTFQDAIFGGRSVVNVGEHESQTTRVENPDFLTQLLTNATNVDIFPELYDSHRFITNEERKAFEEQMKLEHSALLNGLRRIVEACCDTGTCTFTEMQAKYSEELFKRGSIFETAAKTICTVRNIDDWIPPTFNIYIPDTTPYLEESIESSTGPRTQGSISTLSVPRTSARPSNPDDRSFSTGSEARSSSSSAYEKSLPSSLSPLRRQTIRTNTRSYDAIPSDPTDRTPPNEMRTLSERTATSGPSAWKSFMDRNTVQSIGLPKTSVDQDYDVAAREYEERKAIDNARSEYVSEKVPPNIRRNFGNTGQITCFDVSNIIHNLAVLEPGKLLAMPWDGALMTSAIQEQLYDQFGVEINMRRYYLSQYYGRRN